MSRLYMTLICVGLLGCGRQPVAPVAPTVDHSSHLEQATSPESHSGHAEMAGMKGMAAPASLMMESGWDNLKPGVATMLKFHLEREGQTQRDFDLLHERVMHFIVVRDALDEFQHLHPVVAADGVATVEIVFPASGKYWIFVDCQARGEAQQTVRHEMQIAGDPPVTPELHANVPVVVSWKDSQIEVTAARSNAQWLVTFTHRDLTGQPVTDLEPYLGAMGHLVVIGAGTGEYVHAHAETMTAPDGQVKFAAHIARPGIYKGWGQFQRQGQVFTIPFVLKAD